METIKGILALLLFACLVVAFGAYIAWKNAVNEAAEANNRLVNAGQKLANQTAKQFGVEPIKLEPPKLESKTPLQRMVRVAIYDDTERRRIPERAELWLRETGSVWLHQRCNRLSNGTLSCGPLDLGMRDVGQPLELYIYTNGRKLDSTGHETDELRAPFKLTAEMCALGCPRDMITLAISDTTVEVDGAPVMAAGANNGIEVRRK